LVWLAGVDGAAEYLNRRWLEYSGLSQTQAIGWGWTVAVHPEDVDQLTDVWRSVLKAGVRGEAEARLRRFDGEYRWFIFTAEPLKDESGAVIGWCGTNIDITEQRQAKTALQARERELSLIIETIPAFAWSASTDGRLTYVNQRLFDYIGAPMEVLRGDGWVNFVHPDDRPEAIARWLHAVATGAPLENQYRLRRADGVYRWFHVPGQLGRTTDGRPTMWYGLLIDIDDRKNVEEALRLTQIKLSRATQIATVGEIAASIAHEINQPLAAIATRRACVSSTANSPTSTRRAARS
jgi:PAS domain S-box-containing protein